MKYGETLPQRSPPEWEAYNVDYNEIKHFIKRNTIRSNSSAIAIPGRQGQEEIARGFEDELYAELVSQHQRIDLFVRSKAGETKRRLDHLEKIALHLQNHPQVTGRSRISVKRLEKFSKLENEIIRAGDQIQALARYIGAQGLAFKKLLKKYRKWTSSAQLQSRFEQNVTSKPKAFERQDLNPLLLQYNELLLAVRAPFEAGMTWSAKNEDVPNDIRRGSVASYTEGSQTAHELQTIFEGGTNLEVDAALAALPFGSKAGHTSYWVHPENVLQLHIQILQYCRLKVGNSVASTPRDSQDRIVAPQQAAEPLSHPRFTSHETNGIIVCDDLTSFAKGRSGITIDQLEAGAGHRTEASAASIRYAPSGECLVLAYPGDNSAVEHSSWACLSMSAEFNLEALRPLFLGHRSQSEEYAEGLPSRTGTSFVGEDSRKVCAWLRENPAIQPLVHLQYKRSRFFGLGNTKEHGVWITLDGEILMKKSSTDDLEVPIPSSEFQRFPHHVLEIRWEGEDTPDIVRLLNNSHLAERVPGFSLEVHAVAALCDPSAIAQPHWFTALGRDIRKIPADGRGRKGPSLDSSEATKDGKRPSTATNSAADLPSSSGISKVAAESPVTSVPEKQEIPPLALPGKKRRMRRRPKERAPSDQALGQTKHYWNEFDDGEEALQAEAYTVLVDPHAPTPFVDGLTALKRQGAKTLQKLHATLTGKATKSGEREPLLPTDYFSIPPAEPEAESSGESDSASSGRRRPRLANRYSVFPSYHSISSPLDPLSMHNAEKRDITLLRYAIIAFLSAFALLLASGLSQITWRKGTSVTADIAVVFGIVASVTCALAGLGFAMARQENVGWMGRAQMGVMFALLCVGNGVLVVHLVAG